MERAAATGRCTPADLDAARRRAGMTAWRMWLVCRVSPMRRGTVVHLQDPSWSYSEPYSGPAGGPAGAAWPACRAYPPRSGISVGVGGFDAVTCKECRAAAEEGRGRRLYVRQLDAGLSPDPVWGREAPVVTWERGCSSRPVKEITR